jgi:anti-sigma factor RsiW
MARCEDIELLLGPFEDGELEPHEMQEVARHTATCLACEGVLANYRAMGVSLRGSQPIPNLNHFASGVIARIQHMHLPPPVPELKRHWYEGISDWFANVIMTGGLAAAVAIATAVVMTPELARYLHHPSASAQHLPVLAALSRQAPSANVMAPADPSITENLADNADAGSADNVATDNQLADNSGGDQGTVISLLQSDSPSVAVWTGPDNKTTVVWVPDQQH